MIKFREMMFGKMEVALALLNFLFGVAFFLVLPSTKRAQCFPIMQ